MPTLSFAPFATALAVGIPKWFERSVVHESCGCFEDEGTLYEVVLVGTRIMRAL